MAAELATFACGCFWSKEYHFSRVPGVVDTRVGYTGGQTDQPTYQQVCTKTTGHAEAVELSFDPAQISFQTLLKIFFDLHDATQDRRAKGGQYRSAIFYHGEAQRRLAEAAVAEWRAAGQDIVTEIVPASAFWLAEERHQGWCERTGILPDRLKSAATGSNGGPGR